VSLTLLQPSGWPRPRGYSHGVAARGQTIFVAGQIGWNAASQFESDDFVDQARQALSNIVAVLREAGAEPHHLVRLTWYVTSRDAFLAEPARLGEAYRSVVGKHFPPMTVVEVRALMEERALVEIEATAVLPDA